MGKTAGHTPKINPSRLMGLTDISPEGVRAGDSLVHPNRIQVPVSGAFKRTIF